jgi:hypothetical protein
LPRPLRQRAKPPPGEDSRRAPGVRTADIRALAEYLGHADPAFTLRVYRHLMPGSPDRMRLAIGRAFSEAPDHPEITQEGETSL